MSETLKFLNENKDGLTVIIAVIAGLIGFGTLLKAILEYRLQGRQKRAELFNQFKIKLLTDSRINNIIQHLENDRNELKEISTLDKYYFLGFYEQISIAINSGLLKKNVAHYFFGYFALRCWESENFWLLSNNESINKDGYYWNVFKEFVLEMKKIQSRRTSPNLFQKIYDNLFFKRIFRF
jgi:hypothetical protein